MMNFIPAKKFLPIFILYIIGLSTVSAADLYGWSGKLEPGDKILVEDLTLAVDVNKNTGEIALIIRNETGIVTILKNGQFIKVNDMTISFSVVNDYGVVSITSNEFFNILVPTPEQDTLESLREENENLRKAYASLLSENKKLKQRISELEKQLKDQPNTAELQTKLVNLTKENRELKAQIANLTNKYNALQAKADFLEQQNEEYRTMIQNLLKETAQGSEQDYIEKAKKEKLIGSVLLKSIIFAATVAGLIGYGLYRAKKKHDYVGL